MSYTPDMPAALRKWATSIRAGRPAATYTDDEIREALLAYVDGLLDRLAKAEAGYRLSGCLPCDEGVLCALQTEVAHLCDALGVTPEGVKE